MLMFSNILILPNTRLLNDAKMCSNHARSSLRVIWWLGWTMAVGVCGLRRLVWLCPSVLGTETQGQLPLRHLRGYILVVVAVLEHLVGPNCSRDHIMVHFVAALKWYKTTKCVSDILKDPETVIVKIAKFMGYTTNRKEVEDIKEKIEFSNMKRVSSIIVSVQCPWPCAR